MPVRRPVRQQLRAAARWSRDDEMPTLPDMSSVSARALGRLVADISSGAGNEVLSSSLAAVVRYSRPRELELHLHENDLQVNGLTCGRDDAPELATLADVLVRHHLSGLTLQMGVTPRELLQLAALLAGPVPEPGSPSIAAAARALGFWHIIVHTSEDAAGVDAGPDAHASGDGAAALAAIAPSASVDSATERSHALVTRLDEAVTRDDADAVGRCLSEARRAELAAAQSGHADAAAIAEVWSDCLTQLAVPHALRLVAGLVLDDTFPQGEARAILQRAGDAGTLALFQLLSASDSMVHRRSLFDAIVQSATGVPVLVAHLAHERWFVVRNAVCLLGAMHATTAEGALIETLSHDDDRVRTAAATALLQLGTVSGHRALERAIHDSSSDVRRRALRALLRDEALARSATLLSEALDLERDGDVQLDVVASLKAIGTPHAIRQLVRLCGTTGQIARAPAVRRAALEALVTLRPSVAAPLVRRYAQDRDPEIRAHARGLLPRVNSAA